MTRSDKDLAMHTQALLAAQTRYAAVVASPLMDDVLKNDADFMTKLLLRFYKESICTSGQEKDVAVNTAGKERQI
ncbi:MAG: hypothetical protein IJ766_04310 [Clostridia bacterium]|nr:hypothetical protein [Clostridia bacterium]